MDYSKFTKKELIELCEEREISFSSSWVKSQLEEVLIDFDNKLKEKEEKKQQEQQLSSQNDQNQQVVENTLGKAGAIVNIVFGSIALIPWIFLSFFIFGIPFLVLDICSIVSNVRHKNGKQNKVMAGVLGLISSGLIGGVLVLIGNNWEQK